MSEMKDVSRKNLSKRQLRVRMKEISHFAFPLRFNAAFDMTSEDFASGGVSRRVALALLQSS